jgi:hypothetical protein
VVVFLVPVGRQRHELYSETPDDPGQAPGQHERFYRRWLHRASGQWRELVDAARRGSSTGRFAQWRDAIVSRLAESIAEQRTLWNLGGEERATLRYPATLTSDRARAVLMDTLAAAKRHHLRWLIVDFLLFAATGIVAIVPGPNVFAYYMLFRVIGHFRSWWGARRGTERVSWTFEDDDALTELASLVDVPRAARAVRVAAIAERLNLPRLSAFFDRVAVPSA